VLAEAIFAYIDELSADSAEGYAQEHAAAAGEQQRTRYRLTELLLQQPAAEAAAIEVVAAELGWRLPRVLAVACVDGAEPEELQPRLPFGALAVRLQDVVILVLPDPDVPARRVQVDRAAAALAFAVGPTVPWRSAAISYARASAALELIREGVLPRGGALRAREHVPELLLTRDRGLAQELAADRLAPLADLQPAARQRLAETLLAWLGHQGRLQPVARALHVHPQTVRYRLAQLRERFGDALDEPDGRFELELALRAERLTGV
jgi:sugar diacid utilization regulator